MRINLLLCLFLILTGCASHGVGGSYVGDLPQKSATTAIAEDAAIYLAQEYAPGHTSLYVLTPENDINNDFSILFDDSLRSRGFTISPDSSGNAITVSYTLDALKDENGKDNGAWYLQLRLSDGQMVARSYSPDGLPEAGRSAAPLEKSFFYRASEKINTKARNTIDTVSDVASEALL